MKCTEMQLLRWLMENCPSHFFLQLELLSSPMAHWHYNTFSIDFTDPFLPKGLMNFHLNGYGEADFFTIDVYSPDFHFQKLKFERISE